MGCACQPGSLALPGQAGSWCTSQQACKALVQDPRLGTLKARFPNCAVPCRLPDWMLAALLVMSDRLVSPAPAQPGLTGLYMCMQPSTKAGGPACDQVCCP